jgi:competence protein ComEC
MWLLYVSCAWVVGALLGSYVDVPALILTISVVPFALIPFLSDSRRTLIVISLCLLALFGGGLRAASTSPATDERSLSFYNERGQVVIRGTICEEPDMRDTYCLLALSASDLIYEGEPRELSGKALIRVQPYPMHRYGDVLEVTGELRAPPAIDDFDYAGYLADRGIYSVMYYPGVEVCGHGHGLKPLLWIHSLREQLAASLARALPEPQCSLAQGMLLGMRGNIPDSLHQAFSRTGAAHLLAISGLHVTIVLAMFLSIGIGFFGRRRGTYVWIALIAVWGYALLAGMRPPMMRAAIMASLFLMAESLGRQRSGIIALAFAAAVMVGVQPQLLHSLSFQLSFTAMAGLVLLFPHFRAWGRARVAVISDDRTPLAAAGNTITDTLATSLAALLAVWPLIAYNFGVFSLVALPATFFSLPALPFIIVTSSLVAFVGLFALPVSQVLGWLSWLFLSYLTSVVQLFDALPYSSLELAAISPWHVWGYYGILAAVIASVNYRHRLTSLLMRVTTATKRVVRIIPTPRLSLAAKWLVLPLLLVVILIWSAVLTAPDDRLHVTFLDVGQGDSILIQTPAGQSILIDGGPDAKELMLALSDEFPFRTRTIDLIVCTQPQADHITGLLEVLQRYSVTQVIEAGVPYDSSVYQEWRRLIKERGITRHFAQAGQEIDLGQGIRIQVLNPPAQLFRDTSCDIDNNGVVLKLTWNKVSFLLAADIRYETELELIMLRADLRSTVLKVAHHGSMTSTAPQFLAAVDPEVAVISVGSDNRFGHPSPEVVTRLLDRLGVDNVYRTDRHGTIEFITDGERLWVETERLTP